MDMLITVFLQFNFIILVLKHSTGADNVVWEYFYRPGNIAILGENFYTADKAISRLDCLSRCIRCPTVAFDDVSKECRHYNGQNHTIVPVLGPASGLGVWMSKQMTLSAVQTADSSQMTHAEAVNLCQSLGGRLATYRELSDARAEGYHLCSCGWLTDQTARLVLYYDDPACEVQQFPGLHTCKIQNENGQNVYDTHYGAAYCKFFA